VPTAGDINDLEELGFLRTEEARNAKRIFSLTVKGREQARVLIERRSAPVSQGGRAPALAAVTSWLVEQEQNRPELFDMPVRLIDAAVDEGVVEPSGREAFAGRLIQLVMEGYLNGNLPNFDQASDEQRLGLSSGLTLSMKAQDRVRPPAPTGAPSLNFYGSVVAGQIAAGDITNYISFGGLLDRAEEELSKLENVDAEVRNDAKGMIDALRGQAADATGSVLTGAGGGLLATILGQLVGLPPG
jgi:hypothetical protein